MKVDFRGLEVLVPQDFLGASWIIEMRGNKVTQTVDCEQGNFGFSANALEGVLHLPTLAGIFKGRR
jgi:hypothetical protein